MKPMAWVFWGALLLPLWQVSTASAANPKGMSSVAVEILEDVPGDDGQYEDGIKCDVKPEVSAQMTYKQLKALLPALKANGINVVLAIQAHKLADASKMNEIAALITTPNAPKIFPWLVLSWCDGYFANATNYAKYIDAAKKLDAWWRTTKGYGPTTWIVDMEQRWARAQKFGATSDLGAKVSLLTSYKNASQQSLARSAYASWVALMKGRGWRMNVAFAASTLDDFWDGDDGMQQAYTTPLTGIAWDEVSIMAYRTIFMNYCVGTMTNFVVYDYLRTAQNLPFNTVFPNATLGAMVGLTNPGPVFPEEMDYEDIWFNQGTATELRNDVEAALAASVSRSMVSAYDLQGIACDTTETGSTPPYQVSCRTNVDNLKEPRWWVGAPWDDGCTGQLHIMAHSLDLLL